MSRNQRFGLLGLAAVVLVVAFVVARSGGGDDNKASPTSTASADPSANVVVVQDAKPVGGIKRLSFKKGDPLAFSVQSDVADEIHFHGYDIAKDVKAGGTVQFKTKATIEGRFEVELENRKQQIAEVEVTP